MEYKEKYIYISSHKDLSDWLRKRLESVGAFVQSVITSYTTYILEPRQNVIRKEERVCQNCRSVNEQASEYDITYFPLEVVVSDLLDETFNPTWVCNSPDVLTEYRQSSQVLIAKDVDYQIPMEDLEKGATRYGLKPKTRYRRGVSYIVVPKTLTEKSVEWMKHILKRANSDSLYLIREDVFRKIVSKTETTGKQEKVYTNTGDTEFRKALVDEMKETLQKCKVKFPDEFVVVDTEYKRFDERPFENLITEIGIIHVKDGQIVNEFDNLVKSRDIDPRCQWKYKEDVTTPVRTIREIKKDVVAMIGDLPIVGHNVRKDIYLLGRAFSVAFKNEFIDTQDLAKRYIRKVDSYKLEDLAERFGFTTVRHRALGDCETTLQLYNKLKFMAN